MTPEKHEPEGHQPAHHHENSSSPESGSLPLEVYDRPYRDNPVAKLKFIRSLPPGDTFARFLHNLAGRFQRLALTLLALGQTGAIHAMDLGPRGWFRDLIWKRKRQLGETLKVERLPGARKLKEHEKFDPELEALHPVPERAKFPFKARQMRHGKWPPTKPVLEYSDPPTSGKTLAGVGDPRRRRVHKFFHTGHAHIHGAMELGFHLVVEKVTMAVVMGAQRDNRKAVGPVALKQTPVDDPSVMHKHLKQKALEFGAGIVGCTPVVEEAVYASVSRVAPHAIVVATAMEREKVLHTPGWEGDMGVLNTYVEVAQVAIKLAAYIRSLGWEAEADTNCGIAPSKTIHVPLAINAGLGQLGRHTSVISPQFGSNMRTAVVLTDIPMTFDVPIDIGLEEMCRDCTVCMANCPVDAIYSEKIVVRGIRKWHIDYDRCMPYFSENEGCGVCQTVCPWSEPGKAPLITMLQKQRREVAKTWPDAVRERAWDLALSPTTKLPEEINAEPSDDYWQQLEVSGIDKRPGAIHVVQLAKSDRAQLPRWAPGAHVELRLPSGKVRAYSLSNPDEDRTFYRLGIKIEEHGNGGSHEVSLLNVGDRLLVSRPGNNYPLKEGHSRYFLCAGGIGITPMVPIAKYLAERAIPFEVHYSVKESEHALFLDELEAHSPGSVHVHTNRNWLETVFNNIDVEAGVCVCGPGSYMNAVRTRAVEQGLPVTSVYSEDFNTDEPDKAFDVVLASSGERLTIEPGETIARELSKRGIYIPVSCGYGICGTCTLGILSGEQSPRDRIYSTKERERKITTCCSRAKSKLLVLDI
jgi:epoxyqueuosine reductase